MSKEYCYSNWRDEFNPTEYEFFDLIKPDPIKTLDEGKKKGLWDRIHAKRKRGERPAKPGEKGYPETLDIEEGLKKARKNVGASKCWDGYKAKGTKMKDGKEVPNCVKEEKHTATKSDLEANIGGGNLKKLTAKAVKRIDYDVDGDVDPQDKVEKSKGEYGEELPTPFGKFRTGSAKPAKVKKEEFSNWREELSEASVKKYCPKCKKVETKSQCAYGPKYWEDNAEEVEGGDMSEGAAWTKKSGKSESGGLNEKGRKSYERENPGSDLKAPSKKVGNPRRKSFCARMKGMKKKLTSSKTANDPDSRINKSLRAWNC